MSKNGYVCPGCGATYADAGTCTGNPELEYGHEPIELVKAGTEVGADYAEAGAEGAEAEAEPEAKSTAKSK